MRASRRVALAVALAALSAATWTVWMVDPAEVVLFALVAVVTAAASLWMAVAVPRDGWLAAAIVTVIPVAGPLVALWVVSLRGAAGNGADLLWDPHAAPATIDGTELAQRLTRALPAYEALVSGDPELRRATVGRLASRATADDVQLLRCARKRDPQLAVEVAIAFEDLDAQFAAQLRDARAAIAARPGADAHAEMFSTIARAVLAKLVEPSLVGRLAS
ncbi:MAG: hypothetical protein KIT31_33895, partial [Deltaproteobacteria bacterium]|nr:hypothetical protein [Deltaproteobacteria bacterium]